MEPNQSSEIEKLNDKRGYGATTLVVTSVFAALVGGTTVYAFFAISKMADNLSKPNVSVVVATSTLPTGYNFPDRGRTSTVTYAEPDPEVFGDLKFPDYDYERPVDVQPTSTISFPRTIVTYSYQLEFNEVVKSILAVEAQLINGIGSSTARVQKEAAAGNYISMFEAIQQAKKETEINRGLAQTLKTQLATFEVTVNAQEDTEIKRLSDLIIKDSAVYADLNLKLSDQTEATLTGSIPSQAQLNEVQATATEIAKTGARLVSLLKELTTYIATSN